jgi:uncharacterized protein (DUF2132 family)
MQLQPKNPLHGITLEAMLTELVDVLGWEEVAARVRLNCFKNDPSVKSSLTFLRKTPWARAKVEQLYLRYRKEKDDAERYHRASTRWLADCTYGIGFHWTAQSMPRQGAPLPFAEAVEAFRLDAFLDGVVNSGADYVLFTAAHALQKLPCPNAALDAILPGRTATRDLLGEIARGLDARGKPLIVYYNHSCNHGDDPEWEQASGYHAPDKGRLADNLCAIIGELGGRYGSLVKAWWFDSAYALDPRGPHNMTTTDMTGFPFPWERYTAAAKTGYPERLVTYNAGIAETHLYTTHQDYWTGELADLTVAPAGRFLPNGLQWHGWVCLDDPGWVFARNDRPPSPPRFSDSALLDYARQCRRSQAPITFNTIIFQDGTMAEASVDCLARLRTGLDEPGGASTAPTPGA